VYELLAFSWPKRPELNSGVHRKRNVKEQLQLRLMPYNPIAIQIGSLFSLAPKKGNPIVSYTTGDRKLGFDHKLKSVEFSIH